MTIDALKNFRFRSATEEGSDVSDGGVQVG